MYVINLIILNKISLPSLQKKKKKDLFIILIIKGILNIHRNIQIERKKN